MRFRIQDILIVTTATAVLLALGRVAFAAFLMLFLPSTILVIFCPVAIIVTTIVFADQRGTMLDLNTNPLYFSVKKVWILAFLIVALNWSILLLGFWLWRLDFLLR